MGTKCLAIRRASHEKRRKTRSSHHYTGLVLLVSFASFIPTIVIALHFDPDPEYHHPGPGDNVRRRSKERTNNPHHPSKLRTPHTRMVAAHHSGADRTHEWICLRSETAMAVGIRSQGLAKRSEEGTLESPLALIERRWRVGPLALARFLKQRNAWAWALVRWKCGPVREASSRRWLLGFAQR